MKERQKEPKSLWQKTPVSNLIRYVPSGILFARIRVKGRLIRRSLKTQSLSVGKRRLSALEKQERPMAGRASSLSEGKTTDANALQIDRQRLHGDSSQKPRTKARREERIGAIHAMHPARSRLVNEAAERKNAEGELVKAHNLLAATLARVGIQAPSDSLVIRPRKLSANM